MLRSPFRAWVVRGMLMAGIGATSGSPPRSPYVSFGIEVGPTLLVFGGDAVLLLGFNGTFGFFA